MTLPLFRLHGDRFFWLRSFIWLGCLLVLSQVASGQNKKSKKTADVAKTEVVIPQWIGLKQNAAAAPKIYIRKEFEIRGAATSVRLYAVSDQNMTIYLDGQKLLSNAKDDKGKESKPPVFKDVTDLFETVAPAANHVVAVEVEGGGKGPQGVLLKIDFDSGWRASWTIASDATWHASTKSEKGWLDVGFKSDGWQPVAAFAPLGGEPWKHVTAATLAAAAPLKTPTATPANELKMVKGFKAELLYSVPKDLQGSWVNMCVDPKGRLIVSDQYGGLYRVTPPPLAPVSGAVANVMPSVNVEKINVDIGEAQGLLWAFDSLYVVVNRTGNYEGGLYRVRDTNGDDQLDSVETLRLLQGKGEHGPHAVLLAPDGKSLYVVCGNSTPLTDLDASRVPRVWDEDILLPRIFGRGFMRDTPAPGGYICRVDPDGKKWELISSGFRNEFDAAFNADGELFTFDADMEWDVNTFWYRPTRVCQVVSGAEFGWRNGSSKWPPHYPDSVPPVVEIGPGSPTGICFGYGARFPAKYQDALFISDWTFGKMYAVHLKPQGASYTAGVEEFISGVPLPLTDVVINPHDGAMYFLVGGRKVQSGLYRVTYKGPESTAPADHHQAELAEARALRQRLEALHAPDQVNAVETAWPYLNHADRFIRYTARVAIEHRPVIEWQDRALSETDTQAALSALLALVRQFERPEKGKQLDTRPPEYDGSEVRHPMLPRLLAALDRFTWTQLSDQQQVELLRNYVLTFLRLGPPDETARGKLIAKLDGVFPAKTSRVNVELAALLVYLQAPTAATKIVKLLEQAPTQEEQMEYAKTLRLLRTGWTPKLHETYFKWCHKATGYRGGANFALFVDEIKNEALTHVTAAERVALKPILDAKPITEVTPAIAEPRPFVKKWTLEELTPLVAGGLQGRDFEHGRKMFAAANCFACHRFDNQGGIVGPDLTILSGRFSPRDILESIVEPSKVISDQYAAVSIVMMDGRVVTGRIVNLAGDSLRINSNMLEPNSQIGVDRRQIEEMIPSKISMMPEGLMNTLNENEILDLMAYLLSRGDASNPMFGKK
jgi:putative heme-binding domain-containing protein